MGNSGSAYPIKPTSENYFAIYSLRTMGGSYIYAVGLPNNHQVHNIIKQAITSTCSTSYKTGMKTYNDEPNVVKFERRYSNNYFRESLQCKLMYTSIFSNLLKIGWRVKLSSGCPGGLNVSSMFIFEYVKNLPQPESLVCVSVSSDSKLQLISDKRYHELLKNDMEVILNATWGKYGHKYNSKEKSHSFKNFQETRVTEYDLCKQVWNQPTVSTEKSKNNRRLKAGMVIAHVCSQLGRASGWQFLTSGPVKHEPHPWL